jgi:hypothetical protein
MDPERGSRVTTAIKEYAELCKQRLGGNSSEKAWRRVCVVFVDTVPAACMDLRIWDRRGYLGYPMRRSDQPRKGPVLGVGRHHVVCHAFGTEQLTIVSRLPGIYGCRRAEAAVLAENGGRVWRRGS